MNVSENTMDLFKNGIAKVHDISLRELRPVVKRNFVNGEQFSFEEEDYRISYIQAVESLGLLLYPHFDDLMQEKYNELNPFLSAFGFELKEMIKEEGDDKLISQIKEAPTNTKGYTGQAQIDMLLFYQVRKAKLLFKELLLFVQRHNLLRDAPNKNEVKKHEQ